MKSLENQKSEISSLVSHSSLSDESEKKERFNECASVNEMNFIDKQSSSKHSSYYPCLTLDLTTSDNNLDSINLSCIKLQAQLSTENGVNLTVSSSRQLIDTIGFNHIIRIE